MKCAGGPNGDACIVRCRNTTPAGPFGSCVVVTDAQSYGGASTGGASTPPQAGTPPKAEYSPQAATPAGVIGAGPAALADAIPPIIPEYVVSTAFY
jgi:hypothetical protein